LSELFFFPCCIVSFARHSDTAMNKEIMTFDSS
jgi:hypothetical protein